MNTSDILTVLKTLTNAGARLLRHDFTRFADALIVYNVAWDGGDVPVDADVFACLRERGYIVPLGNGYEITLAGREALEEMENAK